MRKETLDGNLQMAEDESAASTTLDGAISDIVRLKVVAQWAKKVNLLLVLKNEGSVIFVSI